MNYVVSGDPIVAALLGQPIGSYGTRSVFFSLSLYPLHYFGGPWPIILMQALLGSWTLRASLRLLWGEDRPRETLGVILVLSALSSLSWTVSLIMPDYLCGLMTLWIFLLCSERSSRTEKFLSAAFTWYAAVSHASHLALLLALIPVSAILFPQRKSAILSTLSVAMPAILSLLVFHGFLYGRPLLFGPEGPPFLTARLLADGTGVRMLEKNGHFTVARYDHLFSSDSDEILWGPGGLGEDVRIQNFEDWKAIKAEERQFVLSTLRHDPLLQLRRSLNNWWRQCLKVNVELSRGSPYIEKEVKRLWPDRQDSYFNSLQNTAKLPPSLRQLHQLSLVLSLLWLFVLGIRYRNQIGARWVQFGVLVGSSYFINAAITGILSKPAGRYQTRIAWLICFTALAVGYRVFLEGKSVSKSVHVVRS